MTDPDIAPAAHPTGPASELPAPEILALEIDDTELEALESDLATIEAAMDRVDSGDLEGAEAGMARLIDVGSDAAVDESE